MDKKTNPIAGVVRTTFGNNSRIDTMCIDMLEYWKLQYSKRSMAWHQVRTNNNIFDKVLLKEALEKKVNFKTNAFLKRKIVIKN